MADPKHEGILAAGMEAWNAWRGENPETRPDLRGANLNGADLFAADLRRANLNGAALRGANLRYADLRGADLRELFVIPQAPEKRGNRVKKVTADLREANLSGAKLSGADLGHASLREADLSGANLSKADLNSADLTGARLAGADLTGADLAGADMTDADFDRSVLCETLLIAVDLSGARNLGSCQFEGPSTVDHRTVARSGTLPLAFLRGCGLPETLIESLLSQPTRFYSCFISHSSKDQDFADRLYADLQSKGVRCFLASEDMKTGARIRPSIDEQIRAHDKLLLVLSEHSIASDWVEQEVESALAKEREYKKQGREDTVLFPVRLDQCVMDSELGWAALIKHTRHIGDFTRWRDTNGYQNAVSRLIDDLKAEQTSS